MTYERMKRKYWLSVIFLAVLIGILLGVLGGMIYVAVY